MAVRLEGALMQEVEGSFVVGLQQVQEVENQGVVNDVSLVVEEKVKLLEEEEEVGKEEEQEEENLLMVGVEKWLVEEP